MRQRLALTMLAAVVCVCAAALAQGSGKEPGSAPIEAPPLAPPPPPAAPPAIITNPRWIERPTGQDFADLYPRIAAVSEMEGRVVLDCTVNASSRLDCSVVSEDPPGFGFGEASLRAATRFRLAPMLEDGRPVDGARIRIPMRWRLGGDLPSNLPPNLITRPVWTEEASAEALARAYPRRAALRGVGGFAVLGCLVRQDGRLEACFVWGEHPEDFGFSGAALNLAPLYRIAPRLADGSASAGRPVLVPFQWRAPEAAN